MGSLKKMLKHLTAYIQFMVVAVLQAELISIFASQVLQ